MADSGRGRRVGRRRAIVTIGASATTFLAAPAVVRGQAAPLTAEEKANIEVINAFIAAWNAKDGTKVMSFFAEDARFAVGPIGKTPEFRSPVTALSGIFKMASSISMVITPGTTWARGPVVTHERVDAIVLGPDKKIAGKYIAVFTLRGGKIVDFIDFDF